MGTYARWQMLLGKTFIGAAAHGRGRGVAGASRRARAAAPLLRPGVTGIHKARHGLAGWNEDFYEAAATPGCVDVTDEKAKSIRLRCRTKVVAGRSAGGRCG